MLFANIEELMEAFMNATRNANVSRNAVGRMWIAAASPPAAQNIKEFLDEEESARSVRLLDPETQLKVLKGSNVYNIVQSPASQNIEEFLDE